MLNEGNSSDRGLVKNRMVEVYRKQLEVSAGTVEERMLDEFLRLCSRFETDSHGLRGSYQDGNSTVGLSLGREYTGPHLENLLVLHVSNDVDTYVLREDGRMSRSSLDDLDIGQLGRSLALGNLVKCIYDQIYPVEASS